jgi:hypothetical protein
VLSPIINKVFNYLHPTIDEILYTTSSLQQDLIDENGFIPLLTHDLDFILQNILTSSAFDKSFENFKFLIISNFEKIMPLIASFSEFPNSIKSQIEDNLNRLNSKFLTFDTFDEYSNTTWDMFKSISAKIDVNWLSSCFLELDKSISTALVTQTNSFSNFFPPTLQEIFNSLSNLITIEKLMHCRNLK